jgi:hypothetical protein
VEVTPIFPLCKTACRRAYGSRLSFLEILNALRYHKCNVISVTAHSYYRRAISRHTSLRVIRNFHSCKMLLPIASSEVRIPFTEVDGSESLEASKELN